MTTPAEVCPANTATWAAWLRFVAAIAGKVFYGPGRGIWERDRYVITYAPGRRTKAGDLKHWPNAKNRTFPAFHCTSLTNVFLSWLLRVNQDFTHAGNIPILRELLAAGPEPKTYPGKGTWRGFAGSVTKVGPDGSGAKRLGYPDRIDMRELLARARTGSLPTFMVFSQSTKKNGYWNKDHHTGIVVAWEGKLLRMAADGYKGNNGYSATPVQYVEITDANVGAFDAAAYEVWGVDTADGSYGDPARPIADVALEGL